MKSFIKENWLIFLIIVFAIVARIFYISVFDAPVNWNDCKTYHLGAINILEGNGYSIDGVNPFMAREPGFSLFFLTPAYFLFGKSIAVGQAVQIFLSILIILLIYWLTKKYFSKKIGLVASLFFAFYPPLVAYSGELLNEISFCFLLLLSLILTVKSIEKKSKKIIFLVGIILGMAILTRTSTLFFPFFLLPFLFLGLDKKIKETLKYFALIFIGILIMVAPYTLRNSLNYGAFTFGRDDGGLNLFIGSYLPWDGDFFGNDRFPLPELAKGLSPAEADKKFKELAMENIKSNPLGVLKIWLKKPARLFFKPEFKSVLQRENKISDFSQKGIFNPSLIKALLLAINIFIMFFALLGCFRAEKLNKRFTLLFLLTLFYFVLIDMPFSPDSRYKLPLMPYLFILASVGVGAAFHWFFCRTNN